jgi:hypothetical protein
MGGVLALTTIRLAGEPLGFVFAFANCAGFMLYLTLGHRIANISADGTRPARESMTGIDQLGAAMLVAAVVAAPAGLPGVIPAFPHPVWLAWGIGVGVCSSVIPYVTDQLAMARLPRATFALMLALLPPRTCGSPRARAAVLVHDWARSAALRPTVEATPPAGHHAIGKPRQRAIGKPQPAPRLASSREGVIGDLLGEEGAFGFVGSQSKAYL